MVTPPTASKYRHRVVGLLACLSVITYLDRVCIAVAAKPIQEELGLTLEQWGWVLSAFVLAYGLFEVPSGMLGDRIGPRRVLTRIVLWWSGFTALTGMMYRLVPMIVTRFLFGAGEAGAYPNMTVAIKRWCPANERGRAQGIVWMASRVGGALAPLIVIPLQAAIGWRASFAVFGALGAIWAAVWFTWFRDSPAELEGVKKAERHGDAQERTAEPQAVSWSKMLRHPNLWWILLMYHANAWCGFFFLTWMPTFLRNGRGYTDGDLVAYAWLPFLLGGIANVAGGFVADRLVQTYGLRWGRRLHGCVAYMLTAGCLAASIFVTDKRLTVLLLSLAYGCSDFALPVAWAVCLDVGGRSAGAVSGAMNMAGQVGSFLTTFLFGYIVTAFGSYDAPLVPIAFMSVVAALAWLKIDATSPLERAQ